MVNYGKLPQITTNLRHFWGKCYSKSWIPAGMRQPWILRWRADCFRTSEKAWKATSFARGGDFAGFLIQKKTPKSHTYSSPFIPNVVDIPWWRCDVLWQRSTSLFLLKGTGKSMVFQMPCSKFLLRMRFVKKDMLNFIPNFDHLTPLQETCQTI
jgi:hypothetical protein